MRWLEAHEPEVIERTTSLLFWKDFIRLRLTDEICTDFTDAGASGLLNLEKQCWRKLRAFLPPLRGSTVIAGEITAKASALVGIPAGTPVFAGAIDCEAAALGSGISDEGDLSIVAGTWSINQTYRRKPLRTGNLFLCNLSAQFGRWLLLEAEPGSAANFDWAVRILLGRPDYVRAIRMAKGARRSNLLFVPGVENGQGTFSRLDASHSEGDLLRAVMEGVVYSHRIQIEKLTAASSVFTRVRFAGGPSRSGLWCQLFADGLNLPVEVPRGTELGALGAALCAGVGVGQWSSLPDAQRAAVRVSRTFMPAAGAREQMIRGFRRFKELGAHLRHL
jgi:L-xylulokinase